MSVLFFTHESLDEFVQVSSKNLQNYVSITKKDSREIECENRLLNFKW